jgi:ribosomal protein S18 acetylase RimI-like enzyme
MTDVEIVLAGAEDEQGIIALMIDFNQAEGITWEPESMGAALHRLLRERDLGLVLVARDEASRLMVGYGLATFGYDIEFAGRDAFITELFVTQAARGRGLGRALLDAMTEELRLRETKAVHLVVRPENAAARALYESRGFRVSPRLLMTRRLADGEE